VCGREPTAGNLDGGVRVAAQLPDCLDDLGHATAVHRVIVAQPSAVSVPRQRADGAPDAVRRPIAPPT